MSPCTVAAVDLGYGHVKYVTRNDHSLVTGSFASYVSLGHGSGRHAGLEALGSLDVVTVSVGGRQYAVGNDSHLTSTATSDRNRDTHYSKSDQYMSLMLGAFWHMKKTTIDMLVVGLPMNTLGANTTHLKKALVGSHVIPNFMRRVPADNDNVVVTVKEVVVMGQPVGALMDACRGRPDLRDKASLVLDMGYNTLDVLGMSGGKPRPDRTEAFPGGVAGYLEDVAKSVNAWVKREFPDISDELRLPSHFYEKALREGKPLQTGLGAIDLQPHAKVASARLEKYMDSVAALISSYGDIAVAVLAGGGAYLIEGPFKRRFPMLRNILIPENPEFSVVRGYLTVGEAMMKARDVAHV